MSRGIYSEVRSNYHRSDFTPEEGDIRYAIYIDAWEDDSDECEGEVAAVVMLTTHGDIVVDFHNNAARANEEVLDHIQSAKEFIKNHMKGEEKNG